MLVAGIGREAWSWTSPLKWPVLSLIALQSGVFGLIAIASQYESSGPNAYQLAARSIQQGYSPGDLVIYPEWESATMTNLYLSPSAPIREQVDTNARDRIVLRKRDGSETVIHPSVSSIE